MLQKVNNMDGLNEVVVVLTEMFCDWFKCDVERVGHAVKIEFFDSGLCLGGVRIYGTTLFYTNSETRLESNVLEHGLIEEFLDVFSGVNGCRYVVGRSDFGDLFCPYFGSDGLCDYHRRSSDGEVGC